MLKDSFFISYSRRDREFVDRLTNDLRENGLKVWRDTENLTPGTASWDKSIRKAIKEAAAIVLVASPDAAQSEYVQGELAVAKLNNCPIYPIWATGSQWIECAPLDMANAQYVDGRGSKYEAAFHRLKDSLHSALDTSKGKVIIGLPTHDTLELNLASTPDLRALLNRIWMFHLNGWYPPFQYGKDWVLGKVATKQIALPWEWLQMPIRQPLFDAETGGNSGELSDYNITANSYWGVWDLSRFQVFGIAVNSSEIARKLQSDDSIPELIGFVQDGLMRVEPYHRVDSSQYTYRFFIGWIGPMAQFGKGIINEHTDSSPVDFSPSAEKSVFVEVGT